jgi:hypothetical protein
MPLSSLARAGLTGKFPYNRDEKGHSETRDTMRMKKNPRFFIAKKVPRRKPWGEYIGKVPSIGTF